jgi:hypothetical protein
MYDEKDNDCQPPQFEDKQQCPACGKKIDGKKSWLELARIYEEIATSGSVCSLDPKLAEGARKRATYCYERVLNQLWFSEELFDNKSTSTAD